MSADGARVAFLRSDSGNDAANDLWIVDHGGEPRRVFDASGVTDFALTDAERVRRERAREQAGGVVSFTVDSTFGRAAFVLGGAINVVDLETGALRIFSTSAAPFDPTFEPNGERIAYVSGSTLRVTDGTEDKIVPGTDEGEPDVSWGSAEFVAAEEMGRGRGYWWSPDGNWLAVCRVDTAAVERWWISSPTTPGQGPRPIRYPAAGTANAQVQLWITSPDDGPLVEVPWRSAGEEVSWEYLADVSWGARLLLTVQSRDQRTLALLQVDPETGTTTEVLRVTDDSWVELQPNTPLDGPDGMVMVVDDERRRLAIDGESMEHELADADVGSLQIRSLVGHGDEGYVVTCTTDGTDSVVACCDSSGLLTLVSDVGAYTTAWHGGGTIVSATARSDAATSYVIAWFDGTATSLDSFADEPGFYCTPHFHVAGSRQLNTALCLPSGHDGSPLPVLLDPYGGPHAQRVLRTRNAYATSQWFAEQGFAVLVVDGRGTPGRGPAFEREIYGDFATKVLDDQIDALQAVAQDRPELDLTRVGIRGWSFGGYLAALAVLRRPDAVHAAIAGAPVTEWRLYDTHYTERYLGHPDAVPEHYDQSSLLGDAADLTRPLMLIHGLADDNVVAAHTLQLSQALLEAGRPHEVLPLSGVTHMTPQEQVAENLLHLQRDFLRKHLDLDSEGV